MSESESRASFDPLVDRVPSRYAIGIDLGTTNCAVTFVDTEQSPWQIEVFRVPQLVAAGEVESLSTLPSFYFQPVQGQASDQTLRLPWHDQSVRYCVGTLARNEVSKTPQRGVASAKSWLCHSGVDRSAAMLPWHASDDVDRLSPVDVSSRYLDHIRQAWNHAHRQHPLEDQDVVITLPASFDEVARELTAAAAKAARLQRVMLIEEPQAAFYAWVYKHQQDWQQKVSAGQTILVCDIGGGTTDFTLIRVRGASDGGKAVQFHRVAVGDHLILGGDNLDLALARYIEQQLVGDAKLPPRQWDILLASSRQAKEQMLGQSATQSVSISLPQSGSRLIGGSLQYELHRQALLDVLVEGFLPLTSLNDQPSSEASGFQEFGLPYAADPAISRYLSAFLMAHRNTGRDDAPSGANENVSDESASAMPDMVLFNGGFFASPVLRQRVLSLFDHWFGKQPIVLDNDGLDLAVARGAAYHAMVQRGDGVKIAASLARTYYIGIDTSQSLRDNESNANESNANESNANESNDYESNANESLANESNDNESNDNESTDNESADTQSLDRGAHHVVCLVPGRAQAGESFDLPQTFQLAISQPIEFPLYVSSTRLADRLGEVLTFDPQQMSPLPPVRTVLRGKNRTDIDAVTVALHVQQTELGTIELSCRQLDSKRTWRLQFDIRSTVQTDRSHHQADGETQGFVDESVQQACAALIEDVFGNQGTAKPGRLVKELTQTLGSSRGQWPMSLLRRLWDALIESQTGRRKSSNHEARWLNLLGYALRPGYGLALDDWRVAQTWRVVYGQLAHQGANIQSESLILWRRIAGGLSRGQQRALAEPWIAAIGGMHRRSQGRPIGNVSPLKPEDSVEVWRLLGSLEMLDVHHKVELGKIILDLIHRKSMLAPRDAMLWTLGRLGARQPVSGPLNTVVRTEVAHAWIDALLAWRDVPADIAPTYQWALVQLSRRMNDRYRDIDTEQREAIVERLALDDAPQHWIVLVRDGGRISDQEQQQVMGESLPAGLRLL